MFIIYIDKIYYYCYLHKVKMEDIDKILLISSDLFSRPLTDQEIEEISNLCYEGLSHMITKMENASELENYLDCVRIQRIEDAYNGHHGTHIFNEPKFKTWFPS